MENDSQEEDLDYAYEDDGEEFGDELYGTVDNVWFEIMLSSHRLLNYYQEETDQSEWRYTETCFKNGIFNKA